MGGTHATLTFPAASRITHLRIVHLTEYRYHTLVRFGAHVAMLRPREGHDLHIASARLEVEPEGEVEVRWLRDIYGNSLAVITFAQPGKILRLLSEADF